MSNEQLADALEDLLEENEDLCDEVNRLEAIIDMIDPYRIGRMWAELIIA